MDPMFILSTEQMRDLDFRAIHTLGIPGAVLMENAGRETVRFFRDIYGDVRNKKVVVIAGKGNNGGDGFVVARHLWNHGIGVHIILLGHRTRLKDDAKRNADIAYKMGIPILEHIDRRIPTDVDLLIQTADVLFDAILGTGLTQAVTGIFADVIEQINQSKAFVVAIDIPSGLSADCSSIEGSSVKADLTVTYGFAKAGMLLYPAAGFVGRLIVADISIPRSLVDTSSIKGSILTPADFHDCLKPLPRDTHKGSSGHLLVIAGSTGKTGAAVLSADAALRTGAGLVTVAVPENLNGILEMKLTEVMTCPVPGERGFCFDQDSLDPVLRLCEGKTAVLIGPGIGTAEGTKQFVRQLLPQLNIPVVLDADGLNCMAGTPFPWTNGTAPVVLTPHPGEMTRLTGETIDSVLHSPHISVPEFAIRNDVHVVFKSARTILADPTGRWYLNVTGNPGLATGGTGDVLAGLIGGFLARRFPTRQAICAAVFLHGLAADLASQTIGEPEMVAGDLLRHLGQARKFSILNRKQLTGQNVPFFDDSMEYPNHDQHRRSSRAS